MNKHSFEIHTLFSQQELYALKEFYSGVRARKIRSKYCCDPWFVVNKHRHLPQDLYAAVKWELIKISIPTSSPIRASQLGKVM
jgi:hypothetical protein